MGVHARSRHGRLARRGSGGRPVLLVTMGVPLDEEASVFAVDTAVESGQRLVVANVTTLGTAPNVDRAGLRHAAGAHARVSLPRWVGRPSSRVRSACTWSGCGFRPSPGRGPDRAGGRLASRHARVRSGPGRDEGRSLPAGRSRGSRARQLPGLVPRRRRLRATGVHGSGDRSSDVASATDDVPHHVPELRAAGGARVLLRRRTHPPCRSGVLGPELAGYLFFRENVNGWQTEWWVHRDGCRRWFLAERHTGTNEVRRRSGRRKPTRRRPTRVPRRRRPRARRPRRDRTAPTPARRGDQPRPAHHVRLRG